MDVVCNAGFTVRTFNMYCRLTLAHIIIKHLKMKKDVGITNKKKGKNKVGMSGMKRWLE